MEALARSRAYALLAELVSRGVTPATREAALASPLLAEALERYASDDDVAVDHQHVLGFSVHPYEGAFLDPDGRVGATATERLAESYARIGFRPDPTGDDPEHLATQLRALAFLSGAEADALADGLPDVADRIRALSARFVDAHLGRWLPPLLSAVRRAGRAFPAALLAQIAELVAWHRAGIDAPPEPFALPELPDLLGDESTGLADVARALATPALAGLYLSRDDVARVARATGVPRGFGDRAVMLHNALRSAAHLDALVATLDALVALVDAEHAGLGDDTPFRARLAETRALLLRLRDAARGAA